MASLKTLAAECCCAIARIPASLRKRFFARMAGHVPKPTPDLPMNFAQPARHRPFTPTVVNSEGGERRRITSVTKTMTAMMAASITVLSFSAAAQAAPWQSINQRQANLESRIDNGVRDGSLTRRESHQLRRQFYRLERLERQYRRNGLNWRERRDLDRRFDALSAQIRIQKHNDQDRGDHRRWR